MGDDHARLTVISAAALQERLADLERQRVEALTRLATIDGAIQACRYWLAYLTAPPEANSATPTTEE